MFQEFGFVHLSAGDLLRAERASGSKDGDLIESYITEGKIVPVEITISLLQKVSVQLTAKLLQDFLEYSCKVTLVHID